MDPSDAGRQSDAESRPPFLGEIAGKRAVVMGIGRFGGGEAAARHLHGLGARVLATDLAPRDEISDAADRLLELGVECRLGGHRSSDFRDADIVVVNPGVPRPWENEFVRTARENGARLLTEIQIALGDRDPRKVVGITGSAGKSTTTAMTAHALRTVRPDLPVAVAGNIGGSLLDDPPAAESSIVAELSSFMLYWMCYEDATEADHYSTGVCAVTNIRANHLDWHGSLAHYEACKNAIRKRSKGHPRPIEVEIGNDEIARRIEDELVLGVPGEHNRRNADLAIRLSLAHLACREGTAPPPELLGSLIASLRHFKGLPHRLELVGSWRGVRVLNDSKASTPEATLLAVESCRPEHRIHLIAGGYDKGADLSPIRDLADRVAGIYAIGQTASQLVGRRGGIDLGNLEAATRCAVERAVEGDTILLSPGCASWDQFRNYEDRGRAFAEMARRLLQPPGDHVDRAHDRA